MIVILQGYNTKVEEKLTKKGMTNLIPEYEKMVDEYNVNLKAAVSAGWKYHDEFEYMFYKQADSLRKLKNTDYAVFMVFNLAKVGTDYVYSPNLDWNYKSVKKGDYDEGDKDFNNKVSGIRISLLEDLNKIPIAMQGMSNVFPTKADLVEGLYAVTWYIEKRLEAIERIFPC